MKQRRDELVVGLGIVVVGVRIKIDIIDAVIVFVTVTNAGLGNSTDRIADI